MSHRRFVAVGLVVMLVCAMVARSTTVSAYSADNLASGKTAPLELSVPTFDELALLPSGASGVAAEINGHSLMWNKVGGRRSLASAGWSKRQMQWVRPAVSCLVSAPTL